MLVSLWQQGNKRDFASPCTRGVHNSPKTIRAEPCSTGLQRTMLKSHPSYAAVQAKRTNINVVARVSSHKPTAFSLQTATRTFFLLLLTFWCCGHRFLCAYSAACACRLLSACLWHLSAHMHSTSIGIVTPVSFLAAR